MTRTSTIFDDRETVDILRERPDLLAIADAVSATLRQPARRFATRRRVVVAAAAVVACAAAVSVAVLTGALGGSNPAGNQANQSVVGSGGGSAMLAPDPVPVSQALSDGAKSFGVPIILPDTSVLKPSDASDADEQWAPSAYPGGPTHLLQVGVYFYGPPYVSIAYAPTAYQSPTYPNALDQYKAEMAQGSQPADGRTPPAYKIVYLSDGTPALITTGQGGNDIEFRLGPLSINIWAPSNNGIPTTVDSPALQALAQSISDQASSATP